MQETRQLNCISPEKNDSNSFEMNGFQVKLIHLDGEPDNANRLVIERESISVEILPSKGLSIGEVFCNSNPIFWDPPCGLVDPDELRLLSDEICLNGKSTPGFTMLKTFMGGLELYGMENWGMPYTDKQTNKLYPLHGETSNIPVRYVNIASEEDEITIEGKFIWRKISDYSVHKWYETGNPVFEINRKVCINKGLKGFWLEDTIKNISGTPQKPDLGYHVTFFAEEGAQLLVPAKSIENRGGGSVREDFETWHKAGENKIRTEYGIIHKGLKVDDHDDFLKTTLLAKYAHKESVAISFKQTPYFQTWFCSGGAETNEFTYKDGTPVFYKNWDGMGFEIGNSGLDHDGNVDRSVQFPDKLNPGESLILPFTISILNKNDAGILEQEIKNYNSDRIFLP